MENRDFTRAYDYIRSRILSGEYPPGRPLMQDVLAAEIGLSRTPVRDALRQLSESGLVTIRPRLGASVRSIDLKEYRDMCGLRMALEIFAAGLAAQFRTAADLTEIAFAHETVRAETERLIATIPDKARPETLTSELLVRGDIQFHIAITTAAGNELIKKEILRQQLVNRIVTASGFVDHERPAPANWADAVALMRATVAEHGEICDAIRRGETEAATRAMQLHLQEDLNADLRRMARGESRQIAGELTKGSQVMRVD